MGFLHYQGNLLMVFKFQVFVIFKNKTQQRQPETAPISCDI